MKTTLARVLIFFAATAGFLFVGQNNIFAAASGDISGSCTAKFYTRNDSSVLQPLNQIDITVTGGNSSNAKAIPTINSLIIAFPVTQSGEDFKTQYYANDTLFSQWRDISPPGQNISGVTGTYVETQDNHLVEIDGDALNSVVRDSYYGFQGLGNSLTFKSIVSGRDCGLENKLSINVIQPSCNFGVDPPKVCHVSGQGDTYTITFSPSFNGFTPVTGGDLYKIVANDASFRTIPALGLPINTTKGEVVGLAQNYTLSPGPHTFCIEAPNANDASACASAICTSQPVTTGASVEDCGGSLQFPKKTEAPLISSSGSSDNGSNGGAVPTPSPFDFCAQIPHDNGASTQSQYSQCEACTQQKFGTYGKVGGVWTAVGCIPIAQTELITSVIKLGLGIAGGVALIMILAAGLMFSTSQGEPKRAGEAKDLMTSAVVGLIFIIFSVALLQFIGVNLLQIPGFGTK